MPPSIYLMNITGDRPGAPVYPLSDPAGHAFVPADAPDVVPACRASSPGAFPAGHVLFHCGAPACRDGGLPSYIPCASVCRVPMSSNVCGDCYTRSCHG